MQLVRFATAGVEHVGVVDGERVLAVPATWTQLLDWSITDPGQIRQRTERSWPIDDVEVLPPLGSDSRGVFCIGFNYREHSEEVGDDLGDIRTGRPPIFLKLPESMLAPGRPIVLQPDVTKQVDWEVELGVVIGRPGRRISPKNVGHHVAGYTVVVDTTARDLQREHGQWFIGKNLHSSSPIGPWVTTVDEIGFPPALDVSLHVNGVEKQRARSDNMIWSIEEFISMVSESIELKVGDVFATGSPSGVGFKQDPPEFLTSGDVLRAEIERLGWLEHAVE